jgi:hypothetical protein
LRALSFGDLAWSKRLQELVKLIDIDEVVVVGVNLSE